MSSSHDKSLRLWERTREPLILEEEREMVRTQAWLQNVLVIGCLVLFSVATPQPVHIQAPPEGFQHHRQPSEQAHRHRSASRGLCFERSNFSLSPFTLCGDHGCCCRLIYICLLQQREAEYEESVAKEDQPVVSKFGGTLRL